MKESTIIRRMMKSDIEEISQAFIHQGWPGREDTLTSYLQDQENGERDVLVADLDGSVAGYITILPDAKHGPFVGVYPELTDFNVFESLKSTNEKVENGKYYAEKTFEVALIPKKSGELTTPEIKIPYFNTKDKKYDFLIITPKKIVVNGNGSISTTQPTPTTPTISNTTNNTVSNTTQPLEEIKIDSIAVEEKSQSKNNNLLIIGLITLVIVEGIVIVYLLTKKDKKSSSDDINALKSAKDDKEFYEAYCHFMKRKYNFSPKVHLEDRLVKLGFSNDFIELNRELESAYYNNIPIDRKDIVRRIKKELRNEK